MKQKQQSNAVVFNRGDTAPQWANIQLRGVINCHKQATNFKKIVDKYQFHKIYSDSTASITTLCRQCLLRSSLCVQVHAHMAAFACSASVDDRWCCCCLGSVFHSILLCDLSFILTPIPFLLCVFDVY